MSRLESSVNESTMSSNSEPVKVKIMTRTFEIEGVVYTAKIGREARKLSNLLNSGEKKFVSVTNATMSTRGVDPRHYFNLEFVQVNISEIEVIWPLEV